MIFKRELWRRIIFNEWQLNCTTTALYLVEHTTVISVKTGMISLDILSSRARA